MSQAMLDPAAMSAGPASAARALSDGYHVVMLVDYLVLADAAAALQGKHYIHGAGWDTIWGAQFPVVHSVIAVAIRLRVPWANTNQPYDLTIDVLNEDGSSILPDPPGPPRVTINVGRPPQASVGSDQVVPLALNIQNLELAQAGSYAVVVRIDGTDAARSAFTVALRPPG
jgi:hypothetical protein